MRRCLWVVVVLAATAAPPATILGLISTVRTAILKRQSDSHLAGELRKISLDQRLDWHTIEELESEGAGPKSVAALEMLMEESQGLPVPAALPFPAVPKPPPQEINFTVGEATRNSLNYASSLPDFFCTETVHRYEDLKLKEKQKWELKDTLTLKLSYFEHVEDYKLTAINGKRTYRSYEEMGGAQSQGEFGSLLLSIFRDAPKDRFVWDHWTTLRKRPTHVFSFVIKLQDSEYTVHFAASWHQPATTRSGQHGFIYVDRDTNRVVRVYAEADGIPDDFPVTNVSTLLDYDFVDVGGRQFLLPLRALVRMGTHRIQTRNEVAFEGYRKFSSDTNITYDVKDGK
jgi:hypothetical protein